mgnify:FL=1
MKLLKKMWNLLKKAWNYEPREIVRHHDNQPYSHFKISSQALKDARKDYEEGR